LANMRSGSERTGSLKAITARAPTGKTASTDSSSVVADGGADYRGANGYMFLCAVFVNGRRR
jgi:hypothetical protein